MMRYTYLGDRMTRDDLRGAQCNPIRRPDGKCIIGKLGTMLVKFSDGKPCIVLRRRLRVNNPILPQTGRE